MTARVDKSIVQTCETKKIEARKRQLKSHRSHVIRYSREKNMLPVNLWLTVLDINCRLQRVAPFEREFSESIYSKIRLSPRYSWDFSISLDCRGFVFFENLFTFSAHWEFFTNHKYLQASCSQTYKFIDHVFFAALRYFYSITPWRCVNKFSLRVTTLNSSLVRVAYENHDN